MSIPLRTAIVIGAGTMGVQIAAHLANAGVDVQLLDVDAAVAAAGWKRALALKPDPLFTPAHAARVRTGAIEDANFGEADWVVEAIVERLEPKRALFERIDRQRSADTVVSSNTSGLPLASLVEGRSEAFARHFVGTHFFNPPRYMSLVEVIPVAATSTETIARTRHWLDVRLGRSVVVAKDSPNFIANHIGLYGLFKVLQAWEQGPFDIDTIDALTGPTIGRPKSATFRTIDITGLDVATQVATNFRDRTTDASLHRLFTAGPRLGGLLERRWIGEKAGQGFFKRVTGASGASDILVLDPATFEYVPRAPVSRPVLEALREQRGGAGGRIKALMLGDSEEAEFTRQTLGATLLYAARVWQDIAHDVDDVDRAMRWGFGWELGPFEIIDAIGIHELLKVMAAGPHEVPSLLAEALAAGRNTVRTTGPFRADPTELLILAGARDRQSVVQSNAAASVLDTGDGIFAVELHSKMNTIGGDTLAMLQAGLERAERDGIGLIIATQGQAFSAGANLMLVLMEAQDGEWDAIDAMVRAFQRTVLSLRDAQVPVVNAINGLTLGGATEMTLHASGVQAAAETYMGLVEVGVGLIPAGCGTKEMLWRANQQCPSKQADALPFVQKAFETIGFGMVSTSAPHARALGFLRNGDGVSMHRSRLHADARELVQARAAGYLPGHAPSAIPVGGPDMLAALRLGVHLAHRAGRIGDHDATIGGKLAWILAGGNVPHAAEVPESYLLDLEREAFLSLCGEPKTQQRIAYTLKTGEDFEQLMVIAGHGPTLLLIPGIQGRWEWARPAVEALARRHRVVSYSLGGERDAVPPLQPTTFDDLVRQAINAVNRVTDGPVVVCGVSYGALIALRLAARHPGRVRALVLASPLNADFAPDDRMRRWVAHPRLMAPAFLAGSPGRIVPELRAAHGREWLPRALGLLGRVVRAPHSPDRMAARLRMIECEDLVADCRAVAQPTLLITGEAGLDRIVPAEASCRMLTWLPHARHVTLDRTGHWGLVTRREMFAREVTHFVETLP